MHKRIGYFLIIYFCFAVVSIRANAEETLTWNDCVKESLASHPDLIAAKEVFNQTVQDKAIARSDFFPTINTELSGKRSKTSAKASQNTYSYSVTGKQLLFDGGKASNEVKAALENVEAAQYNYNVVSSNVRLSLSFAFIELLRAYELLRITEDIAARRKQNLELVRLRYDAGREHRGSLLTAEADVSDAELDILKAKRSIELSQGRLIKELGRSVFSPIQAAGTLETTFIDRDRPDLEVLVENNPFLNELVKRKEAARFGVGSSKAEFFPEVYLNGSLGKTNSSWPPHRDEWSLGATLTFPLFEGGSRFAEVKKAEAKLNQALADERSGRDGVMFTLEETWINFQDAIDEINVREKFLQATEERAKITQAQYSNGLASFDNWIIIEDDLVTDKKAYLNSLADALIQQAYWAQAKGETLEDAQE